jgi:hypothetical protein
MKSFGGLSSEHKSCNFAIITLMDPVLNPFAPGAGTPPPELAGRDELLERLRVSIKRIALGRPARGCLLVGLRGVGKTVLLDRIRDDAEALGQETVRIESPENRSLPSLLAPDLRTALLKLSRSENARELAQRGLRALAGFARALKVKYGDIEVGLDFEPEPGLADNGELDHDLTALLETVGHAARASGKALILLIDELQYVEEDQLASLIVALHRSAQRGLPVLLIGAGLPQLRGRTGRAKSYAERLFEFPEIGPLDRESAERALRKPLTDAEVSIEDRAISRIFEETHGYPYFLQEWGKQTWDVAESSPLTESDVENASQVTIAALDESFFLVRFDRCTPSEKRYLRAMAELGAGPHRSGDIAEVLGREVTGLGPTRNALISKGMVWSPSHGDTAFTVPLFDQFMRRIMPGEDWRL